MATEKRFIEIPDDGIVRIPVMQGDSIVGERRIDLRFLPTVDAVELVRCKDCQKWFRHTQVDRERGDCRRYQTTKHENGYCDRGERKDNDNRT